jgi:hypothetical protein
MFESQVRIGIVEGDLNQVESPEVNVDSIINRIISDIVSKAVVMDFKDRTFPSKITVKIKHNQLVSQKKIVQQYKSYSARIETAYDVVDKDIINGKQTAMALLNGMYFTALEKYDIDPFDVDIEVVRKNADDIVLNIIKQLRKFVYKSANVAKYKEQVEIGIKVVVAHAFVECVVLENPNVTN